VTDTLKRWQLLHSKLPKAALKPLSESVYGVSGLTDVNEGHLIQRLFASEFGWEWKITSQSYLGFEDRTSQSGKTYRVYLASVAGELVIDGRSFAGSGGSDNRKLDAAFKGAATVAFKNACKLAGLTAELYLDGRAIDHIYETRDAAAGPVSPTTTLGNGGAGNLPSQSAPPGPALHAPQAKSADEILHEMQERMRQQKVGGR